MLAQKDDSKGLTEGDAASRKGQPLESLTGKTKASTPATQVSADDYLPQLSPEEKARFRVFEEQTRKVRELASDDPEAMGRLMRVWFLLGDSDADKGSADPPDEPT